MTMPTCKSETGATMTSQSMRAARDHTFTATSVRETPRQRYQAARERYRSRRDPGGAPSSTSPGALEERSLAGSCFANQAEAYAKPCVLRRTIRELAGKLSALAGIVPYLAAFNRSLHKVANENGGEGQAFSKQIAHDLR